MSCTSVLAQDTLRVYVDHEGLQLSRFKGVRLRVIPVDNILLIKNEVCIPFNKLDAYNFQLINNRSDSGVYEIFFECKEIKFKMAVEQYWFESDNLAISVYSYRHWKNRFRIKYGYLFGNSWQGMSSHVEPSSFDCKRIENAQLTHD